jgi:hypothetical protein
MGQSNGVKTDHLSLRIISLKFTFHSTEDDGAKISYKFSYVCKILLGVTTQQMIIIVVLASGARGVFGC